MSLYPTQQVEEIVKSLPELPGVYRYYDETNTILYIGKAKSLKKRVLSYFAENRGHTGRIRVLVSKIRRIEFSVVNSEFEALLLENSLIKKHQPKYNVNLKDGKTYPFITIKNERFPRVFYMRNRNNDGSEYYGPYSSVSRMKVILDVIRKLFPLRSCSFDLHQENINAKKYKVCLDYQIGLCKGPCEAKYSQTEYDENVEQIRKILKGHSNMVIQFLKEKMQSAIENLAFEDAAQLKEKLDLLENFMERSTVVRSKIHDVDVFSIYTYNKYAFVNYLKVVNGTIVQTHTVEMKKGLDEDENDLLLYAVANIREKFNSNSTEIILPIEVDFDGGNIMFVQPKIGDKKKLLELSLKNAIAYAQQKLKVLETKNPKQRQEELLKRMQNDFNLKRLPRHIECFDNSHMQGSFPVSSCVVFKDGKPSKSEYRKFNVKTVDQIDDFATMEEVVERRYTRLIKDEAPLPQLVVIDGGKGQLSSAVKILTKLNLMNQLEVVGIAKRLEEIYKPDDPYPLHVDKTSDSLKVIQHLRNEAHRFAISHHRDRRSKGNFKSELTEIEGIGEKTAKELLTKYRSIKKIKDAKIDELAAIIGRTKANAIKAYFEGNN
ncbi:MAG: excinuclease ABC subunit C [Bacteroidetes bacterium]|nr:excinuclease ABC subunit C [Bacteroidota bacterium]